MAPTQYAQLSTRDRAFTTLASTDSATQNADYNASASLPTGFGDCFIYGYAIRSASITTAVALTSADGVFPYIIGVGGAGAILQSVMGTQWYKVAVGEFYASLLLPRPLLWRTQEQFGVKYRATATDASGSMATEVYVLRLRSS